MTASIVQANKYYRETDDRFSSIGLLKVATTPENGVGGKKNIHRVVHNFKFSVNSVNVRAQQKSVTYHVKGEEAESPNRYIWEFIEKDAGGSSKEDKKRLRIEGSNLGERFFRFNLLPS